MGLFTGILGLLGSLGGAAISSNAANKAAGQRQGAVNSLVDSVTGGDFYGFDLRDVFGSKPKAANYREQQYSPIDYGEVQGETITDNIDLFPQISELVDLVNTYLTEQGMQRAETMAPGFMGNIGQMTDVSSDLLRGELPFDDVMKIAREGNELRNAVGTPGMGTPAMLRDFGQSRLGAMQTGTEFMARIGNLMEQVDPVARQSMPQDWMLYPSQTVPLRQQDNQFAAEFALQNEILRYNAEQYGNNIAAAPDPAAAGLFGMNLMGAAGGFGQSTGGGGIASTALSQGLPLLGQLGSSIFGGGQGGGFTGANSYTPSFNPDTNWSTMYGPGTWGGAALNVIKNTPTTGGPISWFG